MTVHIGGIGFNVFVPTPLLAKLPAAGESVKLFTYLHVKEDILALYGFASADDRALFEDLLSVSSVGPKVAIRIVSAPIEDIKRAIIADDESLMPTIKGVGPKLRKAIILALRDRIATTDQVKQLKKQPGNEAALAALEQLGYRRDEARQALLAVPDSVTKTEDRVREALKHM